jgi:hypothetical protein
MSFLEFIEAEAHHLHDWLHEGDLSERVWDCEPLLVMDELGQTVLFRGVANVDVIPHADHTADLTANVDVNGWRPHLVNATLKVHRPGGLYTSDSTHLGMICTGKDNDGKSYVWGINSCAV